VHKILLNSVLLSPIVSGSVRPKPPGQTPLGHNPPCLLPFVGRLGSGPRLVGRIGSGVRFSVSFQQKYPPGSVLRCPTAAENGGYDQGCCVRGGLTSTHTPWCARRSPPSVEAVFQFTTRMVDNTVDLYAAKPDICPESRFLPTHLHSTSPLEGFLSEYCHAVRYGKSRMVWLPDPGVKKFRKYLHSFWHNSRTCDGRTDRQTNRHRMTI